MCSVVFVCVIATAYECPSTINVKKGDSIAPTRIPLSFLASDKLLELREENGRFLKDFLKDDIDVKTFEIKSVLQVKSLGSRKFALAKAKREQDKNYSMVSQAVLEETIRAGCYVDLAWVAAVQNEDGSIQFYPRKDGTVVSAELSYDDLMPVILEIDRRRVRCRRTVDVSKAKVVKRHKGEMIVVPIRLIFDMKIEKTGEHFKLMVQPDFRVVIVGESPQMAGVIILHKGAYYRVLKKNGKLLKQKINL